MGAFTRVWLGSLFLVLACGSVAADGRIVLAQGDFDDDAGSSGAFLAEYRLPGGRRGLELMATTKGATYLGGFVVRELALGRLLVLTPALGAGWYSRGRDKDLGLALEFRSGAELAARVGAGWRVGLSYHHLSNMSLRDLNPGAESWLLSVSTRF